MTVNDFPNCLKISQWPSHRKTWRQNLNSPVGCGGNRLFDCLLVMDSLNVLMCTHLKKSVNSMQEQTIVSKGANAIGTMSHRFHPQHLYNFLNFSFHRLNTPCNIFILKFKMSSNISQVIDSFYKNYQYNYNAKSLN